LSKAAQWMLKGQRLFIEHVQADSAQLPALEGAHQGSLRGQRQLFVAEFGPLPYGQKDLHVPQRVRQLGVIFELGSQDDDLCPRFHFFLGPHGCGNPS
jgi:hypothetical protein